MVKLVDTLVLGTSGESRGGSSPSARTKSPEGSFWAFFLEAFSLELEFEPLVKLCVPGLNPQESCNGSVRRQDRPLQR